MTIQEALQSIKELSCGTIATLTGKTKYDDIDRITYSWINKILESADNTFKHCKNWLDVLTMIGGI